jgi:hypothetical protein
MNVKSLTSPCNEQRTLNEEIFTQLLTKLCFYEKTKTTMIDSYDRKYVEADGKKDSFIRLKAKFFSRFIEKVDDDEKFSIVQDENGHNIELNGFVRIRTQKRKNRIYI